LSLHPRFIADRLSARRLDWPTVEDHMKFHHSSVVSLGCALLAAASACTEVDSEDVDTSGMAADFHADVGPEGTMVWAGLNVGGTGANATNVELVGDDALKATLDGDGKALQKNVEIIDINNPVYSAFYDGKTEPGLSLTIAFERKKYDSAPESTVALPTALSGEAPDGTVARATDPVVVAFASADDDEKTKVSISGECFQTAEQTVDGGAAGSVTFAAGALLEPEADEGEAPQPASCEATVKITRSRLGTIDKAFGEGGTIQAVRSEEHTFTSAP
jgi:hypothetical protein